MEEKSIYRGDYENDRKCRYKGKTKCIYDSDEILDLYEEWVMATPGKREAEWDSYCDARDGYIIGTNRRIREDRKKKLAHELN